MARGPVTIQRFQPQVQEQPLQRFNYAAGLGAQREAAQALSRLSARLGQAADEADARAGAEAGARAGFDPEFRRMEENTAYARAFNARGSQVFLTRLETEVRGRLDQAYLENRADPAALESALSGLREEYLQTGPIAEDAELRAEFAGLFDRTALTYSRQAARERIGLDEAEARAAASELVDLRLNAVERMAGTLGLDDAADGALAGEMSALQETLAAYGPQGAFTLNGVEYEADPERAGAYSPEQMQAVLASASQRIEAARVLGAFERAGGVEAQRALRAQIRDDYEAGRFAHMDRDGFTRLDGAMGRAISQAETAAEARRRDVARSIEAVLDEAEDAAAAGLPPATPFAAIEAAAAEVGGEDGAELVQRAREARALAEFSAEFRTYSPAQMEDAIAAERERLAAGATGFDAARIQAAERIFAEARVQSQRDPLAWAQRAGTARVPGLDLSTADSFSESLAARRSTAEAAAGRYGAPVRYFTRAEAAQIGEAVAGGQIDRVEMAGAIIASLGPREGARALGEIADEDWELGHVGGLMSVGARAAARDLAEGARLRREAADQGGRAPSYLPQASVREPEQRRVFGEVALHLPGEVQRFAQAADVIYEARARRNGWGDAINAGEYRRALHEAAGAVYEDGRQYGGFGEIRGRTAIAPNWLRVDRFDDAARDILSGAMGEAPVLYAADGSRVDPSRAQRFHLRSAGSERYRVYVNDSEFALTEDGQPYELDLGAWRSLIAAARPEWVR